MELTLKDVGEIIKKGWTIILVLTVAGALLGYGVSAYLIPKQYQATVMMIVNSTGQTQDDSNTMTVSDYELNTKLVNSYSVLSKSDRVLTQVKDRLKLNMELDKLSEKVTVSSKENTDIISLAVSDKSPQMAQSIANTLVDVFKTEVAGIMKMDNVQVIDSAALPTKPVFPNIMINTVAGGLIGLVAAIVISVLRYTMDDTIKESDLITNIMDLPVIGNIPKME